MFLLFWPLLHQTQVTQSTPSMDPLLNMIKRKHKWMLCVTAVVVVACVYVNVSFFGSYSKSHPRAPAEVVYKDSKSLLFENGGEGGGGGGGSIHGGSQSVLPSGRSLQVGELDLHILSAIHYPDTPVKGGFNIFLIGWIREGMNNAEFKCCLTSQDPRSPSVAAGAVKYNIITRWKADMLTAEFTCSLTAEEIQSLNLEKATFKYITFVENSCMEAPSQVLEIVYPPVVKGSVGVCPKIAYSAVEPLKLLEWLEYTKLMGVNKVFTYFAELTNPASRRIIDHYTKTGFLEAYEIFPVGKRGGPIPRFTRPRNEYQAWTNEILIINECKLRMSGYDYVLIMDYDEYIVPMNKGVVDTTGSYFSVLGAASKAHPDAGSFMLDTWLVMLDWPKTRESPLTLTSYVNRSGLVNHNSPSSERRAAMMPRRTFYGINNLMYTKKPWKAMVAPNDLFKLLHFRGCKTWAWTDCFTMPRVRDETMVTYERTLIEHMTQLPLEQLLGDAAFQKNLTTWIQTHPKTP